MPDTTAHFPGTIAAHESSVARVIRHMKASLVEWDVDVSISALAKVGGYSESHFVEVFREATDTTPHHFLASLRIQRAKELLLGTAKTVTDIALDVGYQSFPTFSRTFKDYVGMAPARFRREPRTISGSELAAMARDFMARQQPPAPNDPVIEGTIELPSPAAGVIFVGTFTQGVPQGIPFSGTVMLRGGSFCLKRPGENEFHLFAALVRVPNPGDHTPAHQVEPVLVASQRIQRWQSCPPMILRPQRLTDPPLVVSLAGLLEVSLGQNRIFG